MLSSRIKNYGKEGTACIALDDAGKKDRNSIINKLKQDKYIPNL